MSMTFWLNILDNRTLIKDDEDHSLMHRFSDEMDVVCETLGVAKLSSFVDFTDLQYNLSEEEEFDETFELDTETGYAYGIDDMEWFDISAGLDCLKALKNHVAGGWNPRLDEDLHQWLIEELDDCIAKLSQAPTTAKFHLAVIM